MNRLKPYLIFVAILIGIVYSPEISFLLTDSHAITIHVISAFVGLGAGVTIALTLNTLKNRVSKT